MDENFKDLIEILNPKSLYFNKDVLAHLILKHGVFYEELLEAKDESVIDGTVAYAIMGYNMEKQLQLQLSDMIREEIDQLLLKTISIK